ncbi:MAG TPA: cadherin-like domain-containing protein, partial [Acidimicrobiia bacterium]|nr:cadherin-like domain-containing protein [Acidimicrobiia bacterium]
DDTGETVVDQAVEINVLANDTDIDSSGLTVTNLQTTTDEGGTAAITSGGVTYTPATGFIGTDTFTYTANDGTADSNVATVTVTVFAGELSCGDDTGLLEDDSGMSAIFFRIDERGPCETAKLWTVNFDPDNGTIEFLIDPLFTEDAEYTAELTFEPFTPGNPNTQTFEWDLDNPGGPLTAAEWCDSATFVGGQLTTAVPPEGEDGCVASQTTQTVGEEGQAQTTWWVYFKFDLKTRG